MALYEISGKKLKQYPVKDFGKQNYEDRIAEILIENESLLFEDYPVVWIGKKVRTTYGKEADLIGVDRDGCIVVVELKRGPADRESIAQVIEHTSWASQLNDTDVSDIAAKFFKKRKLPYDDLMNAFSELFKIEEDEFPELNWGQKSVIIGQEIAPGVKDSAHFLRKTGMDIYCMRFTYYVPEKGCELLETELEVGGEPVGSRPTSRTKAQEEERRYTASVVKGALVDLNDGLGGKKRVFTSEWSKYQANKDTWASACTYFTFDGMKMKISSWFSPDNVEIYIAAEGKKSKPGISLLYEHGLKKEFGDQIHLDTTEPEISIEEVFRDGLDMEGKQDAFTQVTSRVAEAIFKIATTYSGK